MTRNFKCHEAKDSLAYLLERMEIKSKYINCTVSFIPNPKYNITPSLISLFFTQLHMYILSFPAEAFSNNFRLFVRQKSNFIFGYMINLLAISTPIATTTIFKGIIMCHIEKQIAPLFFSWNLDPNTYNYWSNLITSVFSLRSPPRSGEVRKWRNG